MTLSPAPTALPSAPITRRRLDFIDGLRALAALWVVLSHAWILVFGMTPHDGLVGWASNWLLYSHLAVDVFIVLSGYCLALPVLRDGGLPGGVQRFWGRRAWRLLPPCYLALALSVFVVSVLRRLDTGAWGISLWALGVNLLLLQDLILSANVFDTPLWSIAVEWRITLVFPLLVRALRRGPGVVLLAAAAVGYGLTALILWRDPALLLACPWYLLLFALGMCAASAAGGRPARAVPDGALAAAALLLALLLRAYPVAGPDGGPFGRHMPLIDTAAGALVAAFLARPARTPMNPALPLLSWAPLVFVGEFSYSLYLTHLPLLLVLNRLLRLCPLLRAVPLARFLVLVGAGLPVLLALALQFFHRCERPFLRRSRRPILPAGVQETGPCRLETSGRGA